MKPYYSIRHKHCPSDIPFKLRKITIFIYPTKSVKRYFKRADKQQQKTEMCEEICTR